MRKEAARYAGEGINLASPNQGMMPGMGLQATSPAIMGMGNNSLIARAAQGSGMNQNPAAQPTRPATQLATPQGIMQAAQKVANFCTQGFLGRNANSLYKHSEVTTGTGNAGGAPSTGGRTLSNSASKGSGSVGMSQGVNSPTMSNNAAQLGTKPGVMGNMMMPGGVGMNAGMGMLNPLASQGVGGSGWSSITPGTPVPTKVGNDANSLIHLSALNALNALVRNPGAAWYGHTPTLHAHTNRAHFTKSSNAAMVGMPQPTPGLTANVPPPPQGAAPAQPPMDPAAQGGAMPPGDPAAMQAGAMPPGDPAAMQGGMPPGPPPNIPPMAQAPPTPLPANPRPQPQQPMQPAQLRQQTEMAYMMGQRANAEYNPNQQESADDLKSQNMAMGKMAFTIGELGGLSALGGGAAGVGLSGPGELSKRERPGLGVAGSVLGGSVGGPIGWLHGVNLGMGLTESSPLLQRVSKRLTTDKYGLAHALAALGFGAGAMGGGVLGRRALGGAHKPDQSLSELLKEKPHAVEIAGKFAKSAREEQPHKPQGWHFKMLDHEAREGSEKWLPRIMPNENTPARDLLSSTAKGALLTGLLGAGLGGVAGGLGTGTVAGGLAGAGLGGGLGALYSASARQRKNDEILAKMRFLPPNATVGELSKSGYWIEKLAAMLSWPQMGNMGSKVLHAPMAQLAPKAMQGAAAPAAIPLVQGSLAKAKIRYDSLSPTGNVDQSTRAIMDQIMGQGGTRQQAISASRRWAQQQAKANPMPQQPGGLQAAQRAFNANPNVHHGVDFTRMAQDPSLNFDTLYRGVRDQMMRYHGNKPGLEDMIQQTVGKIVNSSQSPNLARLRPRYADMGGLPPRPPQMPPLPGLSRPQGPPPLPQRQGPPPLPKPYDNPEVLGPARAPMSQGPGLRRKPLNVDDYLPPPAPRPPAQQSQTPIADWIGEHPYATLGGIGAGTVGLSAASAAGAAGLMNLFDKQNMDKHSAQADMETKSPTRSATGESSGLSFQHKEDGYAQGQEAWASASKYFRGGDKKKPNPFMGKHAGMMDTVTNVIRKVVGGKPVAGAAPKLTAGTQASPRPTPPSTSSPLAGKVPLPDDMPFDQKIQRRFPMLWQSLMNLPRGNTNTALMAGGAGALGGGAYLSQKAASVTGYANTEGFKDTIVPKLEAFRQNELAKNQELQNAYSRGGGTTLGTTMGLTAGLGTGFSKGLRNFSPAARVGAGGFAGMLGAALGNIIGSRVGWAYSPGLPSYMKTPVDSSTGKRVLTDYLAANAGKFPGEKTAGMWDQGAKFLGNMFGGAAKAAPAMAPKFQPGATAQAARQFLGGPAGSTVGRSMADRRAALDMARLGGKVGAGGGASAAVDATGKALMNNGQSVMNQFSRIPTGSPQGWGAPAMQMGFGGLGGYFLGDEVDPTGTGLGRVGGALAGAAAMSPMGARFMRSNPKALSTAAMRSMQGGMAGSAAGFGIDQTTDALGMGNYGMTKKLGLAGMGLGGARGLAARQMAMNGAKAAPIATNVMRGSNKALGAMSNFAQGATEPMMAAGKGALNAGAYMMGAKKLPFQQLMTPNANWAMRAGQRLGTLGLGATGVGMGMNYLGNRVSNAANQQFADMYHQAMPRFQQDMRGMMDEYMQERGMLNQQGQFDPTQGVVRGLGNMVNPIFQQLGIDPSRMSPMQKAMALGGGVAGAGGLAMGSPALAGLGALGLGGAAMPGIMRSVSEGGLPYAQHPFAHMQQQGNMPPGRDEWRHQRGY